MCVVQISWSIKYLSITYKTEVPGSLVPEPTLSETLGSRVVSDPISESKSRLWWTPNRSRNRNLDILILGIGTGIEILAPDLIHTIFAVFTFKKV